jgi:hypothetical protein
MDHDMSLDHTGTIGRVLLGDERFVDLRVGVLMSVTFDDLPSPNHHWAAEMVDVVAQLFESGTRVVDPIHSTMARAGNPLRHQS